MSITFSNSHKTRIGPFEAILRRPAHESIVDFNVLPTEYVLTFDRDIAWGDGDITLVGIESWGIEGGVLVSGDAAISGNVLTLTKDSGSAALGQVTAYEITIDAGAIVSAATADPFAGYGSGEWTFETSSDGLPPDVSAYSPEWGQEWGQYVAVTFVETLALGAPAGYARLYRWVGGAWSLVETVEVTAPMIGGGNTLVPGFAYDYVDLEQYSVTVDAGAITDSEGDPWGGVPTVGLWYWTYGPNP